MSGKIICDLIPNETNNRNSEGAFLKLKNGNLLFAYTRYRNGGCQDEADADIYGIISEDDGEKFSEPFLIFSCEDVGADNIMSVSFMRMENGDVGMFYLQKDNVKHTCIPYLALSRDEGKTWYTHVKCIEEDGYYVLNNDRVIRLDNGRLLMPVAKHEYQNGCYLPGIIYIYGSDDDGASWENLSGEIKMNLPPCRRKDFFSLRNCMEPGIVQLENGVVWLYIRTELGRQYETFSDDFGCTWDIVQPSQFTAPDSPLCVKKLKSGKLIAVWNPIPIYNGKSMLVDGVWTGARSSLVFSVLDKEGNFTNIHHEIEKDERSGFCYCAIYETDIGDILLGYCAGSVEDNGCLNRLRIRKICKNEIENLFETK